MNVWLLAWRNLWRNKRRTLITAASLFFAVFFALIMRSFQLGAYDRLFRNVIESYTGYLQVQHKDYLDEPILDNSFAIDTSIFKKLGNDANVTTIIPRLESFGLAASGSRTQGVMVIGIEPAGEDKISDLRQRLVKFRLAPEAVEALKKESIPSHTKKLLDVYSNESWSSEGRMLQDLDIAPEDTSVVLPFFRKNALFKNSYLINNIESGVIIGSGLADYLKVGIGDTIVIVGQGYHGTSAAGKYPVKGIVKLPAPDIDNRIMYLPIITAQQLFYAPGMATSAVLGVRKNDDETVLQTTDRLNTLLKDPLQVRTWRQMNELLVNQMDADNKSGMIMIGILYLVIAFGVFGTVLMMMAERTREFGMLVSIGMQKRKLAAIISLEMLQIGFLGVIVGVIASLPVIIFGNMHPLRFTGELARMYEDYGFEPVMPTLLPDTYFLWQIVVVFLILLIAVAFSTRKIFRLNVISSQRA